MILFAVAALLSMGILAALWFAWPPVMPAVGMIAGQSWFRLAETILLGITAVGLVGMIVFALAAPRKSKQLFVERGNGGVRISQAALRSTVKHTVEAHRGLSLDKVSAKVVGRANPHMDIRVKVSPGENSDLGELGGRLQSEIATTVEHFAGCPVRNVNITFMEPASKAQPSPASSTKETHYGTILPTAAPRA